MTNERIDLICLDGRIKKGRKKRNSFNSHFESFIKSTFKQKKAALPAKLKQSG